MQTEAGTNEASRAPGVAPEDTAYRWYVLAILTVVATLNGIDKHLMPALAEPIKHAFELSDTEFGLVAGLVYSVGFAIGGIPLTLLIDRVNRTRLLALLLAIWSGATALGSVAGSYAQLAATRFVVGAAEVGGQPISMALIADWFRIDRRGTALGIWTISRSVSLIVSFSVGGYIAAHWGWQTAFLVAGIPGILLSVVIVFTLREAHPEARASAKKGGAMSMEIIRAFIGNRPLLFLAIALVLGVGCQNGIMAFLSSFLTRTHGMPVDQAGLTSGMILGIGAGFGMPLGGVITDFLGKRSIQRQYGVVALLMFASMPAALIGLSSPVVSVSVGGLFIFELLNSCAYTAGLATYLSAVPADKRGSLTSLLTILVIFLGAGMGPPLAGFASDVTGSLALGLCGVTLVMAASGALVVLGMRSRARELDQKGPAAAVE